MMARSRKDENGNNDGAGKQSQRASADQTTSNQSQPELAHSKAHGESEGDGERESSDSVAKAAGDSAVRGFGAAFGSQLAEGITLSTDYGKAAQVSETSDFENNLNELSRTANDGNTEEAVVSDEVVNAAMVKDLLSKLKDAISNQASPESETAEAISMKAKTQEDETELESEDDEVESSNERLEKQSSNEKEARRTNEVEEGEQFSEGSSRFDVQLMVHMEAVRQRALNRLYELANNKNKERQANKSREQQVSTGDKYALPKASQFMNENFSVNEDEEQDEDPTIQAQRDQDERERDEREEQDQQDDSTTKRAVPEFAATGERQAFKSNTQVMTNTRA